MCAQMCAHIVNWKMEKLAMTMIYNELLALYWWGPWTSTDV